jgi:hypothetical protein
VHSSVLVIVAVLLYFCDTISLCLHSQFIILHRRSVPIMYITQLDVIALMRAVIRFVMRIGGKDSEVEREGDTQQQVVPCE